MSVHLLRGDPAAGWRVADIEVTGLSRRPSVGAPYVGDAMTLGRNHPAQPNLQRSRVVTATGNGVSDLSPRRWSIGFGGPTRPPILAGVAIAALVAIAACTPNASVGSTTTAVIAPTSAFTGAPSTSTSASSAPTSIAATTRPPTKEVIDVWTAFWDAWMKVRASDDLDPGPLEAVASPDVVDGALTLFERQRSSGLGPVHTEVLLHATVIDSGADEASVEDCVLLSPSFTDTVGVWYEADLTRTERGWVVDAVRIPAGGGCVPKEMAGEAIAGYKAYYDAQADFWDPPTPDSPLLDEVLVEPQRTFIVGLLEDHKTRGAALRGQPTIHPEVIEVRSLTQVVILDCLEPALDFGLYDLLTNERLPDEPPVREGQRNLRSAVMAFKDGEWKVSDFQGQVDFACEFAPTDRGLPSV